jgi:sugar phosphate permease
MVGISAGGLILAPVIGKITVIYGWKISYFILGLLTWALALPAVVFVIKNSPSELGLNPDGGASSPKIAEDNFPETGEKSRVQQNQGWSFLDALHSRAFWWIAVSFFLAPLAQMGVLQHQVPIIVDSGTSQATAATALGLIAGIGGLGKLGFGRISEMLPYKWVVLICFGLQALAVFLLIKIHSVLAVWTYVVIFGFGMGGVVVLLPLSVGQYFGLVSFGVILGTLWMVQAIGGALGTFGAGLIYDFFGGYQHALYIFLAAYLAAILAMFLAGQPNPHAKTSQET